MTAKLISVHNLRQGIPPKKINGPTVIDFLGPFLDASFTLIIVADTDETQKKYSRADQVRQPFLKFYIMYYAIIYNYYNNVVRIEERPTIEKARKAGQFWCNKVKAGWWTIYNEEERNLFHGDKPNGQWL